MENKAGTGDAYKAVELIYRNSPGRSWQRLNSALSETLKAAITAHLSFFPDDFSRMYKSMNGGYWMGNSWGSNPGEGFYIHAVKVGHTQACISYETFAKRPAALWAWDVKTPERLCIGSDIIWNGYKLTVTNMKADHLIACGYKDAQWKNRLTIGMSIYLDGGYRILKSFKRDDKGITIKAGPVTGDPERKPNRIVKIAYSELADKRKQFDSARKVWMKEIAAVNATADLNAICARMTKWYYRPFDNAEVRAALAERYKAINP